MNAFQSISVVGLVFSVIVQASLLLMNKNIDNVWALYPTWVGVFILGTLIKKFSKEEEHHHH